MSEVLVVYVQRELLAPVLLLALLHQLLDCIEACIEVHVEALTALEEN